MTDPMDNECLNDFEKRLAALERHYHHLGLGVTGRPVADEGPVAADKPAYISGGIPPGQPEQMITTTDQPAGDDANAPYYMPCGICGAGILRNKNGMPIEYHDCKPVPGERLDKALADLAAEQTAHVNTGARCAALEHTLADLRAKLADEQRICNLNLSAAERCAGERDKALARVAELERGSFHSAWKLSLADLAAMTRERDAARAEADALKALLRETQMWQRIDAALGDVQPGRKP